MSELDGYQDEMRWLSDINDADIERLLGGHVPGDTRLEGVAQFLDQLDRAIPEESTAPLETSHVAAMLATSQLLAELGDAAERPTAESKLSADPASDLKERNGAGVFFANLALHKWAAIVVVSLSGLLAFGAAAYAGVLPVPIERAVTAAARQVGITVPAARHSLRPLSAEPQEDGMRKASHGEMNTAGQSGLGQIDATGSAGAGAAGLNGIGKPDTPHADSAATASKSARLASATHRASRAVKKRKAKVKAKASTKTKAAAKSVGRTDVQSRRQSGDGGRKVEQIKVRKT